MTNQAGDPEKRLRGGEDRALRVGFGGSLKLEFHGSKVTSDAGLLACRELDDALGLFDSAERKLNDLRTGSNIQHDLTSLVRQSVYSRLVDYEDVNDAERLAVDPTMRAITGKLAKDKNSASANTMGRFETDMLTLENNLNAMAQINGTWVRKAMRRTKSACPCMSCCIVGSDTC